MKCKKCGAEYTTEKCNNCENESLYKKLQEEVNIINKYREYENNLKNNKETPDKIKIIEDYENLMKEPAYLISSKMLKQRLKDESFEERYKKDIELNRKVKRRINHANRTNTQLDIEYLRNLGASDETLNILSSLQLNKSNIQKESSLEIELNDKEKELEKLKKELKKNTIDAGKHKEIENKLEETEEAKASLKEELEKIKSDNKRVNETINFIDELPNKHLGELKTKLEKRIKIFNRIGITSLSIATFTFVIYYLASFVDLPAPTTTTSYFHNVFFIIFPTLLAFASYRQSNLKSKELEKIDEKLLNSKYLIASLQAIQKISNDSNKDILISIHKLIDSILDEKDEKKAIDDLNLSELRNLLRDVSIVNKTFNK